MDGLGHLGFPHCIGAIEGTHIPIIAPARSTGGCINQKKYQPMLLQGITEHSGQFTDSEVGWRGRHHDSQAFLNSAPCDAMDAGAFVPGIPTICIRGVSVRPVIVGDAADPLRK